MDALVTAVSIATGVKLFRANCGGSCENKQFISEFKAQFPP